MVTWDNTTTEEFGNILSKVDQRTRYCHANHLLRNSNTLSQVDDDIIDISSENTDTPSGGAALNKDHETVVQDASLQIAGYCLRHSSQEKHPTQTDQRLLC